MRTTTSSDSEHARRGIVRTAEVLSVCAAVVLSHAAVREGLGAPPVPGYVDERPDLRRELTYINLELAHFNSKRLLHRAIDDQLASWRFRREEKKAKTLWIRAETKAFARINGDLQKELDETTRTRNDLREASLEAARFANGNTWRGFRHGFIKLVQMVGHAPGVREELKQEAPSIEAADFELHRFGDLIETNGEMKAPPPSMLATSKTGSGQELFDRLRADWMRCVAGLKQRGEVTPSRLVQLQETIASWRSFVEQTSDVPNPSSLTYLDHCERLIEVLASPGSSMTLADFLAHRGHRFTGGTAGDLLQYVLENDLVPRPGTQGHLVLASVTDAMIRTAKTEVAVLDRRLEELKAQSPAHNAAIRQRLVPETFGGSFSGTHAGIDSPAYSKPARSGE